MLKDEIKNISGKRERRLKAKEERRDRLQKAFYQSGIYRTYQGLVEEKQIVDSNRYDRKTQKIINKLPKKLRELSKICDYADIYKYDIRFLPGSFLAPCLAEYCLDKRGKDIVNFLEKNEIEYTLYACDGVIESYYTIRVLFFMMR